MKNRGRDWTYSAACGCQVTFFHESDFHTRRLIPGESCEEHTRTYQFAEREELMKRATELMESFDEDSAFLFRPMTCGELMPEDMEPDQYRCAVCGEKRPVEEMILPSGLDNGDLVCDQSCADDWHERQSEAMFGL